MYIKFNLSHSLIAMSHAYQYMNKLCNLKSLSILNSVNSLDKGYTILIQFSINPQMNFQLTEDKAHPTKMFDLRKLMEKILTSHS